MEQTLVILKPDAVNRGLVGEILTRFEHKGMQIVAMKMEHLKEEKLREHYSHHMGKPFAAGLIKFMSSIPSVLIVIEGKDAVSVVRKLCGVTAAREAEPGTIRGDLSMSVQLNIIHASDSVETAKKEIARFFSPHELMKYEKMDSAWIYSSDEK
jgi:nucleoside-diphosphate kinase